MAELGIDSRAKFRWQFKGFSAEDRASWTSKPEKKFRGLYTADFYGSRCVRSPKRPLDYLMDVCQKLEIKTLAEYLDYRRSLPPAERRRWPRIPWEYYGVTYYYFFQKKKGSIKTFYPYRELRQVLLAHQALYVKDCVRLHQVDPNIPSRPYDCGGFTNDDDLFLYRRDLEIMRSGRRFFYTKATAQQKMRINLIFNGHDFKAWLATLEEKERRLLPQDLRYVYRGWRWTDPVIRTFQSAAEVSLAIRKFGWKSRDEYLAAREKYPFLPPHPENFSDWPSKVEGLTAGFSEAEAWEMFLGILDTQELNEECRNPVYDKLIGRQEAAIADNAEDEDYSIRGESGYVSELAMEQLLAAG